jgi:hypothetical protein
MKSSPFFHRFPYAAKMHPQFMRDPANQMFTGGRLVWSTVGPLMSFLDGKPRCQSLGSIQPCRKGILIFPIYMS